MDHVIIRPAGDANHDPLLLNGGPQPNVAYELAVATQTTLPPVPKLTQMLIVSPPR
jgi:hypothetical protein